MKKSSIIKPSPLFLIFPAAVLILYFSAQTKQGISEGLKICADTIIPSLFPFLCLSNTAILSAKGGGILSKIYSKIFNLPRNTAPVFLFSLIGGFPIGALMAAGLYEKGDISKKCARRLATFCFCSGPAFCISAVGEKMCASKKEGIYLFIGSALSACIMGFVAGRLGKKEEANSITSTALPLSQAVNTAVERSIKSILNICAWITLAGAFVYLIKISPLNINAKRICIALLETTSGCATFKSEPVLVALFLGFGSISVFLQIQKYLDAIDFKLHIYILYRIIGGALSAGICYVLNIISPVNIQTINQNISVKVFSFSAPLSAVLMLSFAVFILDEKKEMPF